MIQPLPNWLAVVLEVKLVAKKTKISSCDCSGCRYFFMLVCKYLLTSSTSKIIDPFSSLDFASSFLFLFLNVCKTWGNHCLGVILIPIFRLIQRCLLTCSPVSFSLDKQQKFVHYCHSSISKRSSMLSFLSRLDYCNALYLGISCDNTHRLKLIKNPAAMLLTGLHWLPVSFELILRFYRWGLSPTQSGPCPHLWDAESIWARPLPESS